jgi:hypothetical protein
MPITMLDILALGDYYAEITDDSDAPGLQDLRDQVREHCRERFRRIDRFSQLCLLGSSLCAKQAEAKNLTLDEHTGLYIGSRFAALANTVDVHAKMMTRGQIPKPAHFINTLSNSAGYYVARNLGLTGKNLFISRADASLEATLQMLQLDLLSGQTQQALAGIVDEGVLPLSEHRQRLDVAANTPLAEGSHWFLLRASNTENTQEALATITHIECFYDIASVQAWIQQQHSDSRTYIFSNAQQQLQLQPLLKKNTLPFFETEQHYYPTQTAGTLLRFANTAKAGESLITVYGDADDRFYLTRTECK